MSTRLSKFFRRSTAKPSSDTSCVSPCRSPTITFRVDSSLARELRSVASTPGRRCYFSASGYGEMRIKGPYVAVELMLSLTIAGRDFATLKVHLPSVAVVGDLPVQFSDSALQGLQDPLSTEASRRRAAEQRSATTPSSETSGSPESDPYDASRAPGWRNHG